MEGIRYFVEIEAEKVRTLVIQNGVQHLSELEDLESEGTLSRVGNDNGS